MAEIPGLKECESGRKENPSGTLSSAPVFVVLSIRRAVPGKTRAFMVPERR